MSGGLSPILLPYRQTDDDPNWLAWRAERFTASRAAVVAGAMPAWADDTESGFAQRIMAHGSDNEADVRSALAWETGTDVAPVCVERAVDRRYGASLDGWSPTSGEWWEIKCPWRARRSNAWSLALSERVQPHIWWQLAHQALVMGVLDTELAEVCCRVVIAVPDFWGDEPEHVTPIAVHDTQWAVASWLWPVSVFADDAAFLADRWPRFAAGEPVGPPLRRPGRPLDGTGVDQLAADWIAAKDTLDAAKVAEAEARDRLLQAHERGETSALVVIGEQKRKGRVDWQAYARLLGEAGGDDVDTEAENYRAASTVALTVKPAQTDTGGPR